MVMFMKKKSIYVLIVGLLAGFVFLYNSCDYKVEKLNKMVSGTWQSEVKFPDWKGYTDDTLAMNSMYSFDGAEDQGEIYVDVNKKVKEFDLFINNKKISTRNMKNGIYKIDISNISENGSNTIEVTNIKPNIDNAITVNIPYPKVIKGKLSEVGISKEPLKLIDKIIKMLGDKLILIIKMVVE